MRKTDALVSHNHALIIKLHCICVIQRNINQQSGSHMDKSAYSDDNDQCCSQVDLDFENSALTVISSEDEVH